MTGTGIAIAAVCVLAAGYIGWLFGFKAGFASASDQWADAVHRAMRLSDEATEEDIALRAEIATLRAELAAIKATRSDAARRGAAARKAKAEASQAVVTAYNARFTPHLDMGEGEE